MKRALAHLFLIIEDDCTIMIHTKRLEENMLGNLFEESAALSVFLLIKFIHLMTKNGFNMSAMN